MDHIGIDVHKRDSQIHMLAERGEVLEQRIRTEPERFVRSSHAYRVGAPVPGALSHTGCWTRGVECSNVRPAGRARTAMLRGDGMSDLREGMTLELRWTNATDKLGEYNLPVFGPPEDGR